MWMFLLNLFLILNGLFMIFLSILWFLPEKGGQLLKLDDFNDSNALYEVVRFTGIVVGLLGLLLIFSVFIPAMLVPVMFVVMIEKFSGAYMFNQMHKKYSKPEHRRTMFLDGLTGVAFLVILLILLF